MNKSMPEYKRMKKPSRLERLFINATIATVSLIIVINAALLFNISEKHLVVDTKMTAMKDNFLKPKTIKSFGNTYDALDPKMDLYEASNSESMSSSQSQSSSSAVASQALPHFHPSSPYAYLWILGGVHEDKFWNGFFWDILISASILRKRGSTADFWLYIRMSPDSKLDALPDENSHVLETLGINVRYLDKPEKESFGQLVYDKFLALNMTDYKRVIFLDADILPLTNLDYLFHLSDPAYTEVPTLLKPFYFYASKGEPCQSAMFMVKPGQDIFDQYEETVRKQHEIAKTLPYPHFDKFQGWGHNFYQNQDRWDAINKVGHKWSWYASHSDQGLLFYVAKFLYKDVSISIGNKIQNWKAVEGEKRPKLESENIDVLEKFQPEIITYMFRCDKPDRVDKMFKHFCSAPYNAFAHFTGGKKPWQVRYRTKLLDTTPVNTNYFKDAKKVWFRELIELNDKFKLAIDLDHWNEAYVEKYKANPLGEMAKHIDQADIVGIVR